MRKVKQDIEIVVRWNEGAGLTASKGRPDPELIRELARELGRMAARFDIAMARKRAAEQQAKLAADLGKTKIDVVG